jgi:hypothetical protein
MWQNVKSYPLFLHSITTFLRWKLTTNYQRFNIRVFGSWYMWIQRFATDNSNSRWVWWISRQIRRVSFWHFSFYPSLFSVYLCVLHCHFSLISRHITTSLSLSLSLSPLAPILQSLFSLLRVFVKPCKSIYNSLRLYFALSLFVCLLISLTLYLAIHSWNLKLTVDFAFFFLCNKVLCVLLNFKRWVFGLYFVWFGSPVATTCVLLGVRLTELQFSLLIEKLDNYEHKMRI